MQQLLPSNQTILKDVYAERILISGLVHHGAELYYGICDKVLSEYFSDENRILYDLIKETIVQDNIPKPDLVGIIQKINSLDIAANKKTQISEYLQIISCDTSSKETCLAVVPKVIKFGLARNLKDKLNHGIKELEAITGDETVTQILAIAERPVASFTEDLLSDSETVNISGELKNYIEFMEKSEVGFNGILTGYPILDFYLGGGLRKSGVHIVGARSGVGKSFFCLNVADAVSKKGIPVLYLDTELTKEMLMCRQLSLKSKVDLTEIEDKSAAKNSVKKNQLLKAAQQAQKDGFYYQNISGMHYDEYLSIARKWITQVVGFNPDGSTKDCLVVLDYIKLMDIDHVSKNFQEYQFLGQLITDLHNFTIKYNIPILSAVQINRDGIDKEDQSIIAGSDRIVSLASSIFILKNKNQEDFAADPEINGNKKIITLKTRFGPGTSQGEYINYKCDLSKACIVEGKTNIQNRTGTNKKLTAQKTDSQNDPSNNQDEDSIHI